MNEHSAEPGPLDPVVRLRVGDHVLHFGDGGADWCERCGTFGPYLMCEGQPTQCIPTEPPSARFWATEEFRNESAI